MGGPRNVLRVAISATLIAGAGGGIVIADDGFADGDVDPLVVATPAATDLNFGSVCPGTTISKSVDIAIKRTGTGAAVFANSAEITITRGTIAGTGLSAPTLGGAADEIVLPSNWTSAATNTVSSALRTTVTLLVPTSPPNYSGTIPYTGVGLRASGNNGQTRDTTFPLPVVATILSASSVACDTVPPTLNVPADILREATAPSGAVVTFTVTASDAHLTSVACNPVSGATFPIGQTVVTCTATDGNNNSTVKTFKVTVQDTTPPTISGTPSNVTAEAITGGGAIVTFTNPTAIDIVDGIRTVSCSPSSGSPFPLGTTTVTCSASDTRLNSASSSFTVIVRDTTTPVLTVPADFTVEATSSAGVVVSYTTSASDTVSGVLTPSCSPASGTLFGFGITTVSCSATDGASNTVSATFKVTVRDSTPPTLVVPGTITNEATSAAGAVVTFAVTATDPNNVSNPVSITCTRTSGSTFALGSNPVSCMATDARGNASTLGFLVNVVDTTGPMITVPADITAEATSAAGAIVSFSVTATDAVAGAVVASCTPAPGSTFPITTTTVTCSATDGITVSSATFHVTVQDSTPPVVVVPDDFTVEATSAAGAQVAYTVTAQDPNDVSNPVAVDCVPATGSVFSFGPTTVGCTATDSRGNASHASFVVTVSDTTGPSITVPSDQLLEATSPDGAAFAFVATATDSVAGPVPVTCSPGSGFIFPLGTTTVDCSATDGTTSSSAAFDVTVLDTTPPSLTVPADITVEATGSGGKSVTFATTATDIVTQNLEASCVPASGSVFAIDTTTVHCSVSDAAGNSTSDSFVVSVVDTTGPALTLPYPIVEATGPNGALVEYTAMAVDLVDGPVAISCSPSSGTQFTLGTTSVDCTSTDARGNTTLGVFDVLVRDTTAPTLNVPAEVVAEATSAGGAEVAYSVSADDAVTPDLIAQCAPMSGTTFALGTTAVTCSVADAAGNETTATFDVVVQDTTAPLLVLPQPEVEATGPNGAAVAYDALAIDLVDGESNADCTPESDTVFAVGTTAVQCSATDAHGNTNTGSFVVTVTDHTPPVVTVPDSFTRSAVDAAGAVVTFDSSAEDIVDGSVPTTCTPTSGTTFPIGSTTVTCSATDAHGNTGAASFIVTVADRTPPVLTLPADINIEATSPNGSVVTFAASALDNVDGVIPVMCTPSSGSVFALGTTTVDCHVEDTAHNTTMGSFSVTVVDTTAPLLYVPALDATEATGPDGAAVDFDVTASDIVDEDVVPVCSRQSGSVFAVGSTTVTCEATDESGNAAPGSFIVVVQDTTDPEIDGVPSDLVVEAEGISGAHVTFTNPTATDVVDVTVTVDCVPPSGSLFALDEDTEVVCSATDSHGNSASQTFVIRVQDTNAPSLVLSGDITAEATASSGASVDIPGTASDTVDGPVPVVCSPPSGTEFPLGSTLVMCSATDHHDNASSGHLTVTVVDTTPPNIHVADVGPVEATGPTGAIATYIVTADDIADPNIDIACDRDSGDTFVIGFTTVTCTATDDSGNSTTDEFTIAVVDTTKPVLTLSANLIVEATGPDGAAVSYAVSAQDVVDGAVTPSCTPATGTVFALGTTSVSCSATDSHGNSESGAFTVTVEDTTAPLVIPPDDILAEATSSAGATVSFVVTVVDAVDSGLAATCVPPSGSTFPLGPTTVQCSATDGAGNTGRVDFDVIVQDTTGPVIDNTPADLEAEATSASGATVDYTNPTATDIVDGPVVVACVPPSGSTFPVHDLNPVTCTAVDAHGNPATTSFNVAVKDRSAPALTVPGNIVAEATGPGGAVVTYSASASDVVDGTSAVTCLPGTGMTFVLGTTTVNCSAVDAHGNTSTASFTVTVRDTTAPTVTVPANMVLEATGPGGATASFATSALDIVDGTRPTVCSKASGATFALGTTTVICTATDARGNSGSASFKVIVNDTTGPVLTLPANITAYATGPFNHDNDDDDDDGHRDHGWGHSFHGLRGYFFSGYWYRGHFYNQHHHGSNNNYQAGAIVQFDATATDLVDGARTVTCTPPSGSYYAVGTTTVNCSAKDRSGNTTAGAFTITVKLDIDGFFSPVSMTSTNVVKGGSTVPLKFSVTTAGGQYMSSPSLVTGYTVTRINATTGTIVDLSSVTYSTNGCNGDVRFNANGRQFVINWQTPRTPGYFYRVDVNFVGGQKLSAKFQMK